MTSQDTAGGLELLALERAFDRLLRFLGEHASPLARAMAIANFVASLPADLQGRGYYLAEIVGQFTEALGQLQGLVADPEHIARARLAVAEFVAAGLASEADATKLVDGLCAPPGQSSARTSDDGRSPISLIQVALVQSLPGVPGKTTGEAIGTIVPLAVVPHARRRSPPFRWNNWRASQNAGSLRALDDVSADAFLAAAQSIPRLAGDKTKVLPHLPESLGRRAKFAGRYAKRLAFELSLPQKEVVVAGDSIGLALAVAFAGALLGVVCRGRGVRPRRDLAWTGCVSASGRVLPVDFHTISAKLRAAHFSRCRAIVVPAEMKDFVDAEAARQGLKTQVIGVGHVSDILVDPNIVEPFQIPAADVEGCTHEKRWRLVRIASVVSLAALLAWHIPPRPRELITIEERHQVKIKYQGLWPAEVVQADGPIAFAGFGDRFDGDRNSSQRLVIATRWDPVAGQDGSLTVYDQIGRTVWRYPFTSSGLPFEPTHEWPGGVYSAKRATVGDVDRDGKAEIVVAAVYQCTVDTAGPAFLWLFDGLKGPKGAVYHDGHLEDLLLCDLDGNAAPEILAAGLHERSRGVSILVLDSDDFSEFIPANESYSSNQAANWRRDAQRCLCHIVVPMPVEMVLPARRENLGRPETACALSLAPNSRGEKLITYDINVTDEFLANGFKTSDYMISFCAPCENIELAINDEMHQRANRWLNEGSTRIDFGSREFLQSWRSRIRCSDRVQVDWPDQREDGPDQAPQIQSLAAREPS